LSVRFDRYCGPLPCLLSFLTRRSSDLAPPNPQRRTGVGMGRAHGKVPAVVLFADFAEAGKDVHELHGRSLLVALVCLEGSRSPGPKVSAHWARVFAPLLRLQSAHAGNMLCSASAPPLLSGLT